MFRPKNLLRKIDDGADPRLALRVRMLPVSSPALLITTILLLAIPTLAQRGGGAHVNQPVICVYDCPAIETLNTEDALKDFRRSMALQATADQRAAFAKVSQYAEAAAEQLQALRKSLQPNAAPAERASALDQSIEKARASTQNFLASLSTAQKSGLPDLIKRLTKADYDLDRQIKALDQMLLTPKPDNEPLAGAAAALDKAFASFESEQRALAREMSIFFDADEAGVAFSLPPVINSITIDGAEITIPTSGAVLRQSSGTSGATPSPVAATAPAENAKNIFTLKFVADLSDVQQNITAILRAALNRAPRCGERINIQQASLNPLAPDSSLVAADLHFERWVCPAAQARASLGSPSPTEIADGNAVFEVKLTPSLEAAQLNLAAEITRVEATGMLRNELRSGDLGVTLRDQIAAALLDAFQKSADVKRTLPPVAQTSAVLQKAQFQDAGADQLNLVLDGQLQFSEEQTKQFAAQLKQRLSAQGTTTSTDQAK
jgi:hypothetical protein